MYDFFVMPEKFYTETSNFRGFMYNQLSDLENLACNDKFSKPESLKKATEIGG